VTQIIDKTNYMLRQVTIAQCENSNEILLAAK